MSSSSDELERFVRKALAQDIPRQRIEGVLLDAGWPREKVGRALGNFAEVDFPLPVPTPQPYPSAREAFLYLLLFTTLFISAFNFGSILFELIEWMLPDPGMQAADYSGYELRSSVSYVVVAFPIFLFLTVRLEREMRQDPVKRGSKVRKWLTYLTLFVAASFLIGDLVVLIQHFLEGELTIRFLLKVAVVAVIAGTVFGYYLRDLQKEEE